jgi:hypothetical protein
VRGEDVDEWVAETHVTWPPRRSAFTVTTRKKTSHLYRQHTKKQFMTVAENREEGQSAAVKPIQKTESNHKESESESEKESCTCTCAK